VAEAQGVCTQTVYERRQQWLSKGFAGLHDAARSGAPGKLSAYLSTIEEWAQTSPLSAGETHQRLVVFLQAPPEHMLFSGVAVFRISNGG